MKKLVLTLFIIIGISGYYFSKVAPSSANPKQCLIDASNLDAFGPYQDLIVSTLQELTISTHKLLCDEGSEIVLFEIQNPDYFFISLPSTTTILGSNIYRIGIGSQIIKNKIPANALKGILAHELNHTLDYHESYTIPGILRIWIRTLFNDSNIQYERQTDLKTLKQGYAEDLKAYKNWQYPLLSQKALEIKRIEYLTPEDINDFLNEKVGF